MARTLLSGSSGPGSSPSSPGRGHCVVFLGKTLCSYSASLYPGVYALSSHPAGEGGGGGDGVGILLVTSYLVFSRVALFSFDG